MLFDGSLDVFCNLVHEDAIISLGSDRSVGKGEVFSKTTAGKEAHSTAALSCGCGDLAEVPTCERLDDTAERWSFPAHVLGLECISNEVIENVEGESPGE